MFQHNIPKAKSFIKAGEYPPDNNLDPAKLAAMMQLIHTMYNMDESETKS